MPNALDLLPSTGDGGGGWRREKEWESDMYSPAKKAADCGLGGVQGEQPWFPCGVPGCTSWISWNLQPPDWVSAPTL